MNLTKTINKINKINSLLEKLEEKRKQVEDAILDWIYSERKQVLDYHNTGHYRDQFKERDCNYHTLSARLGVDCVVLHSNAHYGDRDVESMEIPLTHLFQPELVANLVSRREALFKAARVKAQIDQEESEKKLFADLKAKYEPKS